MDNNNRHKKSYLQYWGKTVLVLGAGWCFSQEKREIYHKIFEYKARFTQKVSEVRFLNFLCYNTITHGQKLGLFIY